ncbi:MAG TPA: NADH-quinone oxidoreductase subunit L [Dictyobacter sp.]|jgi:NADH-quinone oxidoreductase subunit L|nr:NADH-quinone oxidoreductase subunit L [Dictyobacter sp.]
MLNLSFWVLLIPLLGFIILGLAGRFMHRTIILTIGWGACGLSFLLSVINFFAMLSTPAAARLSIDVPFTWISAGSFQVSFGQYLDPLTMVMLLIVTGVGFLIHIYSAGYMQDDPGFWRFFAYLNFFIFAMLLLVTADNFLFLLVGWGLVGLASFLLIGFWYQRPSAVAAAKKAFVINVIGDAGLMVAIYLLFTTTGSLNYTTVLGHTFPTDIATIICLLLFVACAAKSAQLPLYMWLPDAMEGPTPVSALIHAATMVTAGVYLVARAHPLFSQSPAALLVVASIGGITALFAATIALTQLDIKRVLAYSTISQLGYMFLAEGVQNYTAGIFHLITHAFFKALLFLGAGAVIHMLGGEQDMRKMGGLWGKARITAWTFLIGVLAISGIFPLSGFWSKDSILGSVLAQATTSGSIWYYVLWVIGLLTAGLTAFYMFRLFFGIFAGNYRGETVAQAQLHVEAETDEATGHQQSGPIAANAIHEVSSVMSIPLIILAMLSIIGGFIGSFALFGLPEWSPLAHFLPASMSSSAPELPLGLDWISTGISLVLALLGIALAWSMYGRGFTYKESHNPFYQLSLNKYYVDEGLNIILVRPLQALGRGFSRGLEDITLDGGSRGIARIVTGIGNGLRRVQTGYTRNYALGILIGVVLIIAYYAVRG